jgi:hypothetical protein
VTDVGVESLKRLPRLGGVEALVRIPVELRRSLVGGRWDGQIRQLLTASIESLNASVGVLAHLDRLGRYSLLPIHARLEVGHLGAELRRSALHLLELGAAELHVFGEAPDLQVGIIERFLEVDNLLEKCGRVTIGIRREPGEGANDVAVELRRSERSHNVPEAGHNDSRSIIRPRCPAPIAEQPMPPRLWVGY